MKTEITYYNPQTRQTRKEVFDEDWRAEAFVKKVYKEGKFIRGVRKIDEQAEKQKAEEKIP